MAAVTAPNTRTDKVMPIIDVLNHGKTATPSLWSSSMQRSGLFARLRLWAASLIARDTVVQTGAVVQLQSAWRQDRARIPSVNILHFPESERACLRRLGADMKARFASLGLVDFAPFILDVDPVISSRLWIDPVAYVESRNSQSGFRIVIDDVASGALTFETHDFDLMHGLVCHYIFACLTEPLRSGAAE